MTNAVGLRIGDYWIDEEIPARSIEVAYRTTHRVLPRSARVAILKPALVGARPAEVQLMREACILEALHHTGVPRVFECGVVDRRPWIATEFIAGTTIEQAAAQRPLTTGDALGVVRDAAAILVHAHQRGVVHRNLTPRSIVRTPGRGFPVCITEWGDASIQGQGQGQIQGQGGQAGARDQRQRHGRGDRDPADHAAGADAGSVAPVRAVDAIAPFYRAPEVCDAFAGDARSDVFALGVVMFEAATLVLPEPVQKFPGMPAAFHGLLASMLSRLPDERPTAATVHAEASRLTELFSEGDAAIEEVEVELVDISRAGPASPNLGWIAPDRLASMHGRAIGSVPIRTMRRRKDS